MRKRIYEIVERTKDDQLSDWYDAIMLFFIIISIAPLMFKESRPILTVTDRAAAIVFIIDYILRWITADYKLGKKSVTSFIKYPFTPMAIIDMLSILPFITYLDKSLRILRVFRFIKALRVFRVFRTIRYSGSMEILVVVMKESKRALLEVASLAMGYVFVSALVVFSVEPESFKTFFDAIYWATVSLTTVGYGDIYPVTTVGRTVAMISSVFGIAIVALPSGIVTAGYLNALSKRSGEKPTGK
ncbi:ion transporter [Butyrivibrio sp. INlla16]|uniref:ion transporter n=1 Tax=Butyrivibrio sp. INlla16 TaxID=1520807 RepID=UPI00088FA784|nr:ion transporter [Butyrivibrio sp. INlla16]SDB32108.1 voltage-gated potassium channel [Butyrivibrio sp. INlla16]